MISPLAVFGAESKSKVCGWKFHPIFVFCSLGIPSIFFFGLVQFFRPIFFSRPIFFLDGQSNFSSNFPSNFQSNFLSNFPSNFFFIYFCCLKKLDEKLDDLFQATLRATRMDSWGSRCGARFGDIHLHVLASGIHPSCLRPRRRS